MPSRPAGLLTLAFLLAAASFGGTNPYLERVPLRFEANTGQAAPEVRFYTRASDYSLGLTAGGSVLRMGNRSLRMSLAGSNPNPAIVGQSPLASRSAYYMGNRPELWRRDVPHYSQVRYREVYPGIDLVYYGRERRVEHDFVVSAGSNPAGIRMRFHGADRVALDASGDLVLHAGREQARQLKPVAYQEIAGVRRPVEACYRILGRNEIGFSLGAYDPSRPLVIDPVLVYSSYLGGTGIDVATAVAVDSAGYVWVAGSTSSTDFPAAGAPIDAEFNAKYDIFVAKFDPNVSGAPSLVYVTYLGGADTDEVRAMVERDGFLYLAGSTVSTDFPLAGESARTSNAGDRDTFVVMLHPSDGGGDALWYSSYVGGADTDFALGLAVDASRQVYVTGYTESTDFPLSTDRLQGSNRGGYDAFFYIIDTKVAGSGGLWYSTYLGAGGTDVGTAVAVESSAKVLIAGYTTSEDFPLGWNPLQPTAGGKGDIFLTRLDLSKPGLDALEYSTFYGGSDLDVPYAMVIDPSGAVCLTGYTLSADFPVTGAALQATSGGATDAFVARFDLKQEPGTVLYSSYLGGSADDMAYGLAVDAKGRFHIAGYTHSGNFPTSGQELQRVFGEPPDAFAAVIDPSLTGASALLWSAWLGGDRTDAAYAVAVDAAGGMYVVGGTESTSITVTPGAYQGVKSSYSDGFLVKIDVSK